VTATIEKSYSSSDVETALNHMADAIANNHHDTTDLFLAGIAEGGVPVANRLGSIIAAKLGREIPQGVVDVSFHRDDIGSKPIPKITSPTEIHACVDGGTCILVDDVLHTGRSVRAGLSELFDQGRLDHIELAVLVDRGNRKLPIQPDYVGFVENIPNSGKVAVEMDSDNSNQDQILITAK
jgi:pyrimidine operon attenuation protein/uracil phosphoribosyltransferase